MVDAKHFLGYDKDEKGHLIINPAEAEIIKRFFREYLEGFSCQKIARGLEELIDRTESRQNYDDLVEEILLLREQQEQTNMDEAAKAEHRDRIQALCNFINSQPRTITKFDGTLVRKLLKDVKVCDVFIEFRFKSGTSVIIEK